MSIGIIQLTKRTKQEAVMYKKTLFVILGLILFAQLYSLYAGISFDEFFVDKTMRVDFYHTGTKGFEVISLDKVYEEPAVISHDKKMWAGNKMNLIDTMNMGTYLAKVVDTKTNQIIYSRGFSSIYGEWETTGEAEKGMHRTFHESVLFPFPKEKVQFVIAVRDKENYFHDIFSTVIDPNSRFVNRDRHTPVYKVDSIIKSGDPHKKVDLVILGDGYTKKEIKKYKKDVMHFTNELFSAAPLDKNKDKFNVWYIETPSEDSGIDEPRKNIWRNTVFGCSFNSFDFPRYVLTFENKAIRDIASLVPYDQIYIIFNSERYGGGGIFNLYSTCYSTDKKERSYWWPDYVFVHEFGHAFGGLGDEYYTSDVAYNEFYPLGVDPWEPNVGIIQDGHIKWENYMEKNTPIPTPWGKAKYDSLDKALRSLDRSASDYKDKYKQMLAERKQLVDNQKYNGKVGAFEGSGYASKGLYRPFIDCRMFSKSLVDFCPVCKSALEKMIEFQTK